MLFSKKETFLIGGYIGTDLMKSKFQTLNRGSDKRKNYKIKNHNGLVDAFSEVEPNS